jgi:serine/threonine protein kinase
MGVSQTLRLPGYEVLQFLGSGARSTIWQVKDRRSSEHFALKRVIKRRPTDGRFLEQAVNEYHVGVRFDHPAIRKVHRLRRVKRWLSVKEVHLLMELCQGRSIQDARPDSVAEIVRIFLQVASALAHMNASGFVHADMKPNNILVGPDGTVKIIDLGQSCPLGTVKQRIQGTPDFIAPEQVHRRPLDARTDVFNFGAAMYWTLTGRAIPTVLPQTPGVVMKANLAAASPEQVNPQVPGALSKLVMDCIEVMPSRRPEGMGEVVSRLGLIARRLGPSATGGPAQA